MTRDPERIRRLLDAFFTSQDSFGEDEAPWQAVAAEWTGPVAERLRADGVLNPVVASIIERLSRRLRFEGLLDEYTADLSLADWLEPTARALAARLARMPPPTTPIPAHTPRTSTWNRQPPGPRFDNRDGEGLIERRPGGICVAGQRVFETAGSCGTCTLVFARVADPVHRLTDGDVPALLGDLDAIPSDATLRSLARPLATGRYHPVLLQAHVRRVEPGSADDCYANEVEALFDRPNNIGSVYYRFGPNFASDRGRLLFAFVMPLHDPNRLDPKRIAYWREQFLAGRRPTALALGWFDEYGPAASSGQGDLGFHGLDLLQLCLLDGHHRVAAAAELGLPLRVLAFVSPYHREERLTRALDAFAAPRPARTAGTKLDLDPAKITSITMQGRDRMTVIVRRDPSGTWRLITPPRRVLDAPNLFLESLAFLATLRAEPTDQPPRDAFANSVHVVFELSDDSPCLVEIGAAQPGGRYVRTSLAPDHVGVVDLPTVERISLALALRPA